MKVFNKVDMLFEKLSKKKTKSVLTKIRHDIDEDVNYFGVVISSVIKNKLPIEEINWINKIEQLRKIISKSSENISITDCGAGSQVSHPSTEK